MRTTKTMLAVASASAIAIGTSAFAGSSFDTNLTDLGSDQYQLQDTFTINYNLMTTYIDFDQNGTVDTTVDTSGEPWATPSFDGFYSDPEHYALVTGLPNVYFMGNQMNVEDWGFEMGWALHYGNWTANSAVVYSTILFGTMELNAAGDGLHILNIRDGIEWPVNGDQETPATRIGFAINDFDSFTLNEHTMTLAANVVPGPLGVMALAGFGLAARRRNR